MSRRANPRMVSTARRRLLLALAASALCRPAAAVALPDSQLLHRDGRRVRLLSDVWRGRVALINFVFTSCASFCGVQSAMQAQMQARLQHRLGRDVVLISLSIDPLTDDPPRLDAYARAFAPGPHWWWLTGEPREVFRALQALGAERGDPREHEPLWIVGRATARRRVLGFPSPGELEAAVLAALRT